MRKIRLSDTDIEFFDMEVSPTEFLFFTKHKDAFRCMWKEQGKPFWTRFIISFRSYTVKHGVIKQMSFDSPKLNDLLDQGFINMHEQFLEGSATSARSFVDDIARLAQNHDKFPNLDSKNFAKDPFYCRETRELFRQFFGSPDQKASYLKVYILSPVYLRFGGSVCRCLKRWMDAPPIEFNDESYWTAPAPESDIKKKESKVIMCSSCLDECGTLYFQEKLCGKNDGPKFIESWSKGDPRFNDKKNPLYNKIADPESDWRSSLSVEDFRDFVYYSNNSFGEKCSDCIALSVCPLHNSLMNSENTPDSPEKKKRKRKKKKKEKEKETNAKTEDEIEKLVNHIEGTAPLKVMPENTIAGAKDKSPTKENSPPAEEKTDDMKAEQQLAKREIFTKKAKVSDDFKYGIMPYQDKSGADLKRSVIGGFKVKRIEDERTGACEITVTITTIKGENAKDRTPKLPGLEKNEDPRRINRFPLTADLLRTKMIDLPKKMEWYEGWNWCASVLNFDAEERDLCANPTNFTIKVTGREEECVKRTMFKLLFYVIQRKCRPCPGWNMEDDDIVACILPDESTEFEGITICIIRGFRFEERLTDEEKATMQSPPEECIAKPKKVMMTWQPSKAKSILKATPSKGRAELKELLLNVGSIVNRVDEIPDDCSPQKRRQLELKIQKQMTVLKARPPKKIDEGPMYKQMKQNPDTFELFIMSDGDRVDELESIGMMAVDVDIDEENIGNFCEDCGQASPACMCVDHTGKKKQLPECNCVNCLKEICVGALAGDFDHILAKDGIIKENGKYVAKTPEQIEADLQNERKNVEKVLGNFEKRVAIKQQAEGTDRVITKKVAQSIPQPKVIKIDKSASIEQTIEEIKIQTTIYRNKTNRSEKGGKKTNIEVKRTFSSKKRITENKQTGNKSPEKEDSDIVYEIRRDRIKELEMERAALRKMVLDEKEKEEAEKRASKDKRRKEIESNIEKLAIKAEEDKSPQKKDNFLAKGDNNSKKNELVRLDKKPDESKKWETDKAKSDPKSEKQKIEIEIKIPLKDSELPFQNSFELNEKFVKENPDLLKRILEALDNAENIHAINMLTDDAKVCVGSLRSHSNIGEKLIQAGAIMGHGVIEHGPMIPDKPKEKKKVQACDHRHLCRTCEHDIPSKDMDKEKDDEVKAIIRKGTKRAESSTIGKHNLTAAKKNNKPSSETQKKMETKPLPVNISKENGKLFISKKVTQVASSDIIETDTKSTDSETGYRSKLGITQTKTESSASEKEKSFSSNTKETEKTFNIIKQTSKTLGEKPNLIAQIIEEAEEKIVFEKYDGMRADIILTGEPQCPCQVKAKELMKAKLKKRNQMPKEPTTTLKKELSHRLHCPEQLSVREEKPSLTSARPPCLANDPTVDINEIIEEQLIDSFNIKRLVKVGMKISQNAVTQTNSDSDGVKPLGFKEKIITPKPWTEERSKCVIKEESDFQRYLKFMKYKQQKGTEIGVQAGEGLTEEKNEEKAAKDEKMLEKDQKSVMVDVADTETIKREGSPEKNGIRKCANCDITEPAPKAYMKCQKCKLEGITNARYYCGRECQVKDWSKRHKKEHKENLLI
ncbi:uncharacterized protein LOC127720014 [Mytilus californianus]|uniref:uncharacterized protein LOC127720014 n=1 Tax=Mytilus californianus TaxID=6549 RepID=UPI0022467963|nr:uncharacterized protein LOC127720014 [Mytilus californianus]XP_052082393.1 uncharacterized protein LOC127720014 [Mytilus californianus]XP_052082400.1 uncharacterized protein LOC127720014 [Mytilus californianus]